MSPPFAPHERCRLDEQGPLRKAARLLVVGERSCEDRLVGDLPAELEPGDLLVFNDTRVIPARLVGQRGEATVEVTLHQPVPRAEATSEDAAGAGSGIVRPAGAACWRGFARPAKRLRVGDRVQFGPELAAEVLAKGEGGEVTLGFALAE